MFTAVIDTVKGLVFTFHSGYILINFEEEMPEKAMTLHSILVIF